MPSLPTVDKDTTLLYRLWTKAFSTLPFDGKEIEKNLLYQQLIQQIILFNNSEIFGKFYAILIY